MALNMKKKKNKTVSQKVNVLITDIILISR